MAETEKKNTDQKPAQDEKTTKKKKELAPNTMSIHMVSSAKDEINIEGGCSDLEIKAICRALSHGPDQKFEVKKHNGENVPHNHVAKRGA